MSCGRSRKQGKRQRKGGTEREEVSSEGRRRNLQQREKERERAFELPVAVRVSFLPSLFPPSSPSLVSYLSNAATLRLPDVSVSSSRWTYFHTPGVWSGSSAEDESAGRCAWSCYMEQTLALNSVSKNQSLSLTVCMSLGDVRLPVCCFLLLLWLEDSLHLWVPAGASQLTQTLVC